MKREGLIISGKRYVTTREAAKVAGYAPDYVGQLCRAGKLDCTSVGRSWFVAEESVLEHKRAKEQKMHEVGMLAAAPRKPLLPKEAQKVFLPPLLPRQLLADISGIAALFVLSLGFAWGFTTGAPAKVTASVSHAMSSFSEIVHPELPVLKHEAHDAFRIISTIATTPGATVIAAYQDFLESAARGSDLLGKNLLDFSQRQFIAAGQELGGITTALMELHLSLVENTGPMLLGVSDMLLDASLYAQIEAGKGLAFLTDALLDGYVVAVETLGASLALVGQEVTTGYMAVVEQAGEMLATTSSTLLESYNRGLSIIGDTLADATSNSVGFGLRVVQDGVGSILALHATLITHAGDGLRIASYVPLFASQFFIERSGEVVATSTFFTMNAYSTLIDKAGGGLASVSSGILTSYTRLVAFVADKTGAAIEPTVTRMAVIFGAGVEVMRGGAERYLGALAAVLPRTERSIEIRSSSDENIFLVKHPVPEDYFDEVDALSLDAAMASHELSFGVTDILQKAEVASMQATLLIDTFGYAAVGASGDALQPLRQVAHIFYRTVFGFKMALGRSFNGLFTVVPEQVNSSASPQGAQGVVVVPSRGAEADAEARARIQSIFSDAVEVQPDASGAAGVIVPQFKHRESKDFLYVLVPINE